MRLTVVALLLGTAAAQDLVIEDTDDSELYGASDSTPTTTEGFTPPGLEGGRVSVFVRMTQGQSAENRANVAAQATNNGGTSRTFPTALPDVINLRNIPQNVVEVLENLPGVESVETDVYQNFLALHDGVPLINAAQDQLINLGYTDVDGSGVRVCVVDTGIRADHVVFENRVDTTTGYDFYSDDSDPADDNGHGTHCAGIIGTGMFSLDVCGTSQTYQGVAPGATLIGVKVLGADGSGYTSDVIAGIDYCADPTQGAADVISMSLGGGGPYTGPCDNDLSAIASNNAVAAGVVVVVASGNDGWTNGMSSPACASDVISVGATWKNDYPNCETSSSTFSWSTCTDAYPSEDQIACFSNGNDYLTVSAPGASILAASHSSTNGLTSKSGTSMATPMVAGLAALILDADPTLTPAEVEAAIIAGAIDLGTSGHDTRFGHGRVDAAASLDSLVPAVCGDLVCEKDEDICTCSADCGSPAATETSCTDGIDNDCDNLFDCDDPDCDLDTACFCDFDGICESGENCDNCGNDCGSLSGASCGNGVCESADGEDCTNCAADCAGKQGGKPSSRYCCGLGGINPVECSNDACNSGGFTCSTEVVPPSCCGDGTCEGGEDVSNCGVDCDCNFDNSICDDGIDCTDDVCNADGTCSNSANDSLCADDNLFCTGSEFCDATSGCQSSGDPCDSGYNCDEDTSSCIQCGGRNAACSSNSDCCSGRCRNNGKCSG